MSGVPVDGECLAVRHQSGVCFFAIIKQESGCIVFPDRDFNLGFVVLVFCGSQQQTAVCRSLAFSLQPQCPVFEGHGFRGIFFPERPLQPQFRPLEVVGKLQAVTDGNLCLGKRACGLGTTPSVRCPLDRFDKGLTPQSMVTFGVCVVHHPPVSVYIVYQCAVPFGPPAFPFTVSVHQRVERRVLPRTEYAFRACRHDHVTGARSGSSAFGRREVIVAVVVVQFRRFQIHAFRPPVPGIGPTVVDLSHLAHRRQSVVGELHNFAFGEIQVTFSIRIGHMSGVDAAHLQIFRCAPRPTDVVRPYHPVRPGSRIIDVIPIIILHQIRCHGRAFPLRHGTAYRFPMLQVLGMPDEEARRIIKRRMRHVVILPVAQDGGVGIVSGKDDFRKVFCTDGPTQ